MNKKQLIQRFKSLIGKDIEVHCNHAITAFGIDSQVFWIKVEQKHIREVVSVSNKTLVTKVKSIEIKETIENVLENFLTSFIEMNKEHEEKIRQVWNEKISDMTDDAIKNLHDIGREIHCDFPKVGDIEIVNENTIVMYNSTFILP